MKLSRDILNSISSEKVIVPKEEMFELPERVLQFGTGVLLRGLPDYFIDVANRAGIFNGRIIIVKSTSKADATPFVKQTGLYTLCQRGIQNGVKKEENIIISSISRVLIAQDNWGQVLECAFNENLKIIISNTTEAGIQLVNEDIHCDPPASYPGKLLSFLYERFISFKGNEGSGLVIIPTELILDNGIKLKSVVLELAHLNSLEDEFIEWLEKYNYFCNSLVDRIVTGMPGKEIRNSIENELGYEDDLLAVSEIYSLWAIEGGEKIKNILSFAKVNEGMVIKANIEEYRELKLRLLNGTHTLACAVSFLAKMGTVKQSLGNEIIRKFIEDLMRNEIAPSIPFVSDDTIKQTFISIVLDRFENPHIHHHWKSIALKYSSKMNSRCIPLLINYYKRNEVVPQLFALGFAAYLYFMKAVKQVEKEYFGELMGEFYLIEDEMADRYYYLWNERSVAALVEEILKDKSFWENDLSLLPGFQQAVTDNLNCIITEGMMGSLESIYLRKKLKKMNHKVTKVHPSDNVLVALGDLAVGEKVTYNGNDYTITDRVPAKHKFVIKDLQPGDKLYMYGVLVGKAQTMIPKGGRITTLNVKHAASEFQVSERKLNWLKPDVSKYADRTFMGFHRADGKVGTANYWLVIPMVFCENRNIEVLQEVLENQLGYGRDQNRRVEVSKLVSLYKEGKDIDEILSADIVSNVGEEKRERVFPNVDGIQFLTHDGGCGGTREDAEALCGLLAGYITHPNVAGATILSLGCQNAQIGILQEEIKKRDKNFSKPLYILEQQQIGKRSDLISKAIKQTFAGLVQANNMERKAAPLSKLCIGLECGGSDGFSGISANPAIGYTSDLLVALGGTVILSEFPELCGVEQNLSDRCITKESAIRFEKLMKAYNNRAKAVGSGFDMNPSPGNIKDGLITDAIKSAGAAKKGGTSPVADVLDYPEMTTKPGLNLLCTPGNDVESTTAEVGSGANIVLFTTGLGTPTGNPIAPVIKLSSNTALYNRMNDLIDINTGTIIEGEETIEQAGERILDFLIKTASGETEICAVRHGQNDFIPWKRGISL